MKLAIASDLHLEFEMFPISNEEGADVLILAGDIAIAADLDPFVEHRKDDYARKRSQMFHDFFQRCSHHFKDVIYIMGNHEHYHGDFATTSAIFKERLAYLNNIRVLDKESVTIGDITFIGSTLWTDMNDKDPLTLMNAADMMSDFNCVINSNKLSGNQFPDFQAMGITSQAFYEKAEHERPPIIMTKKPAKFSPIESAREHARCLEYITQVAEEQYDRKFVVVSHHTPSWKSCAGKYAGQTLMNGCYHTELFDFIYDRPQIKAWIFGHTHHRHNYFIGETICVCNPRGYKGYEENADTFRLIYLDLDNIPTEGIDGLKIN